MSWNTGSFRLVFGLCLVGLALLASQTNRPGFDLVDVGIIAMAALLGGMRPVSSRARAHRPMGAAVTIITQQA